MASRRADTFYNLRIDEHRITGNSGNIRVETGSRRKVKASFTAESFRKSKAAAIPAGLAAMVAARSSRTARAMLSAPAGNSVSRAIMPMPIMKIAVRTSKRLIPARGDT